MSSLYSLNSMNNKIVTLEQSTKYDNKHDEENQDLRSIIEFNENVCISELRMTRDVYTALLESSDEIINEGALDGIIAFIKNILRSIKEFFNNLFNSNTVKEAEDLHNKNKENLKDPNLKENLSKYRGPIYFIDFEFFSKPISSEEFLGKDFYNRIDDIISSLNKIFDTAIPGIMSSNKEEHSKIIIESTEKINSLFKDLNNNKEYPIRKIPSKYFHKVSDAEYNQASRDVLSQLYKWTKIMPTVLKNNKPDIINDFEKAMKNIDYKLGKTNKNFILNKNNYKNIKEFLNSCSRLWLMLKATSIEYISSFNTTFLAIEKYMDNIATGKFNNMDNKENNNNQEVKEEMASLTLDDVIFTEFAEFRYNIYDIFKEGMIKEALIMSNPDIEDKLYAMQSLNEALDNKISNAFNRLIQSIRRAFEVFSDKLKNSSILTKRYLDKYKNVILKNKVPDGQYTGKDFISGINRINNFEIPDTNYTAIKANLQTPYAVFQYFIQGKETPREAPVVQDGNAEIMTQIAQYFKTYFGCAGIDVNYNTDTLEKYKETMFNFVYDNSKIIDKINRAIGSIEKMRANAIRQTGGVVAKTNQPTPDGTTNPAGDKALTKEGYFSYLNNLDMLLEDWTPAKQSNTVAQSKSNGQIAQMTAGNNNQRDPASRTANNSTVYGQNAPNNTVETECVNYAQVSTQILKAELTAIEFINKEIMDFFRNMVAIYVEGETVKNPATPQQVGK